MACLPTYAARRGRARAANLALVGALAAGCGDGPAAPTARADLAGRWYGATAAHELDLDLVEVLIGPFNAPNVQVNGTYRDRTMGESVTLPGSLSPTSAWDDVDLSLFSRPPVPDEYRFRGRLQSRTTMSGWLVVTGWCPRASCPEARRDSVAITLQRR